jgi:hypothetical protein
MIFRQWREILDGKKTQTRRVVNELREGLCWQDKNGDECPVMVLQGDVDGPQRVKWQVGRTYAVQRKRGEPAIWWRNLYDTKIVNAGKPDRFPLSHSGRDTWQQLRIRITDIRQERLHDITEGDAIAEGCEWSTYFDGVGERYKSPINEYAELWDSINEKTKGARWADNPLVWALTFEVVR